MDFKQRLQKAAERGGQARDAKAREAAAKALSEKEMKRLHSTYRIELTDRIEQCLQQLADQFPGFRYSTVISDKGWGAAVYRDDVGKVRQGGRDNFYSRLEMLVSPHSKYHVLELVAKGTVRNKKLFSRSNYQLLSDVDTDSFLELVDLWVLEYAEVFAAKE